MVEVEPCGHRFGIAVVIGKCSSLPLQQVEAIGSAQQVEEAALCLKMLEAGANAQRVARHVQLDVRAFDSQLAHGYLPACGRTCGVLWHGVAKRHVEVCIGKRGIVDAYRLLGKVYAAAMQQQSAHAALDTCRGHKLGCIEAHIVEVELVYHHVALEQWHQAHADVELAGIDDSICNVV